MPKILTFSTYGDFRKKLSFLHASLNNEFDDDTINVNIHCDQETEDKIIVKFTATNGIEVYTEALLGSELLDNDVCVNLNDLYNFCNDTTEDIISMWVVETDLYIGSYFNEKLTTFELESKLYGKPFIYESKSFQCTTTFEMDQITMSTIIDAMYEYETIDIYRKNGIISYRVGDNNMTIATTMLSSDIIKDLPDFGINIPCSIYKLISLADEDGKICVSYDEANNLICINVKGNSFIYACSSPKFSSETSENYEPYLIMNSMALSLTLDKILALNKKHSDCLLTIRPENGGISTFDLNYENHYNISVTAGELMVLNNKNIELPIEALIKMVRKNGCDAIEIKLHKTIPNKLFICYKNGTFMRKCLYNINI